MILELHQYRTYAMSELVAGQSDRAKLFVRPTGTTPSGTLLVNCSWKHTCIAHSLFLYSHYGFIRSISFCLTNFLQRLLHGTLKTSKEERLVLLKQDF